MKSQNFCPLCGSEKARFIKGLCEDCFLKKNPVVELPAVIQVEQCRGCGKTRIAGKMSAFDPEKLSALVKKKAKVRNLEKSVVSVSVEENDEGSILARVLVKGIIDNVALSFEKTVPVEMKSMQCDACMRLSSQYHAAMIQLRAKDGNSKRLKELLPKVIAAVESSHSKDSLAVVIEVLKKREGFDLKVGSKKAAQNAVGMLKTEFGAKTKFSTVLIGMNASGKEKNRFVFLVRV
ncbi:MAG: 60S ribosomal export protein NMD3 [archaeon]